MYRLINKYRSGLALLLAAVFLLYSWGCYTYKHVKFSPVNSVEAVQFYVADASFPLDFAWRVDLQVLRQTGLEGKISKLTKSEAISVNRGRFHRIDTNQPIRNVVLYVDNNYAQSLINVGGINLLFEQVVKSEVYEFNRHKSSGWVLVGLTAPIALMSVLALVACSCPYVYADNMEGPVFEGDIFTGATHPQLERHDWLPLTQLKPKDQEYHLRIVNEDPEIQYVNMLELVAVDHKPGIQVMFDKYGRLHSLAQPEQPVLVTDLQGQTMQEAILKEDDVMWQGTAENSNPRAEDGLILHFQRPPNARQAKLVIRANSATWLAYSHEQLQRDLGEYGPLVRERFLKKDSAALQQWALQQNIPLSVSVKNAAGNWQFADFFHLIGPEAPRKDLLQLDLSNISGDLVQIKLSTGFMFWEIDYVGLDFSTDEVLPAQALQLRAAADQQGIDLKQSLSADDQQYYVQAMTGDEAKLRFAAPATPEGLERSLFLHAKGHYKILHETLPGKPAKHFLRQFQKPDAFPKYARTQWESFTAQEIIWTAPTPEK